MAQLAKALAVFIAILLLADVAVCTNYTVGGSPWGIGNDYKAWTKTLTFRTGDFLIFDYDDTQHDVAEVTKADYDKCNLYSNPIYYDMSGHTVIQLKKPGTRYFICTVPLHCSQSGMKLEINVVPN
ncbi:hypothetical protein LUZ60_008990 [Juncus effusus]|nr:hypothetical protein LUZ60_008990 [Juncus effusus]